MPRIEKVRGFGQCRCRNPALHDKDSLANRVVYGKKAVCDHYGEYDNHTAHPTQKPVGA